MVVLSSATIDHSTFAITSCVCTFVNQLGNMSNRFWPNWAEYTCLLFSQFLIFVLNEKLRFFVHFHFVWHSRIYMNLITNIAATSILNNPFRLSLKKKNIFIHICTLYLRIKIISYILPICNSTRNFLWFRVAIYTLRG